MVAPVYRYEPLYFELFRRDIGFLDLVIGSCHLLAPSKMFHGDQPWLLMNHNLWNLGASYINRSDFLTLVSADILRQPVQDQLRDACALGERTGLIDHVGEVFRAHGQFLVPLKFVDTCCR